MTIDEVAHQLQISHGSACEIIHNRVAVYRVCSCCVHKQLIELHKEKCLDISKWLLDRCGAEGDNCLERIVTGDEIWIHHYEPESKCQSVECKRPHLPAKKKFEMHPPAGRFTLTVFWDSQWLLLEHYQRGVKQ